ncbi:MAG: hypothetical protein L0I29_09340 [Hyphomicrobiales bacterium]|nr:hypothetical protein [Hyphomicrobiales bacterium]
MPAIAGLIAVAALAGCNTASTLNSAAPSSAESAASPSTATPTPPGQTATAALPVGDISSQRVQFAPTVGTTAESVGPLSKELSARAKARGLTLVPASDPSTTLLMKGYFSALTDNSQTTVIYVWDVLDPAGNRLHRIEGQQKAPPGKGEGFAAVTEGTMKTIADQTIDQLVNWLSAKKT